METRRKILTDAYKALKAKGSPPAEAEDLVKLLDILTIALEKHSTTPAEHMEDLANSLIDNYALLAMLKQQTDELDALKKLSINLTSSLDLPDVLDAVVREAMRLIENARDRRMRALVRGLGSSGLWPCAVRIRAATGSLRRSAASSSVSTCEPRGKQPRTRRCACRCRRSAAGTRSSRARPRRRR